jgi:hypothetical protein
VVRRKTAPVRPEQVEHDATAIRAEALRRTLQHVYRTAHETPQPASAEVDLSIDVPQPLPGTPNLSLDMSLVDISQRVGDPYQDNPQNTDSEYASTDDDGGVEEDVAEMEMEMEDAIDMAAAGESDFPRQSQRPERAPVGIGRQPLGYD